MGSASRPEHENPQILQRSIGFHLFRVQTAMHARFETRLAAFDVTPAQWAMLAMLSEGEQSPAQLARQMRIDRAAVLRTSQKLISRGLIARRSQRSRRTFGLALTAAGRKLLPKLSRESSRVNQDFFNTCPLKDQQKLLAILKNLDSATINMIDTE